MRIGLGRNLAQLVDDVLRRGLIRVAHAQIDDVLPGQPRGMTHGVDLRDYIGGHSLHPIELIIHRLSSPCLGRD